MFWDLGAGVARQVGEGGGGGVVVVVCGPMFFSLCIIFPQTQCVPSSGGWPGNSVSLAYPMTNFGWFPRMCSPSHGLVSKGQVPWVLCCRQCPEANSLDAEKGGNCPLLSQGLWAGCQKLEQRLNEMRSFEASVMCVPPPPYLPGKLEVGLTGGALVGLGTEAVGQKWVVSTSLG